MRPVGYLVHGAEAGRGTGYNYVMAGNGLFLEAEGPLITAQVLLAGASILPPGPAYGCPCTWSAALYYGASSK